MTTTTTQTEEVTMSQFVLTQSEIHEIGSKPVTFARIVEAGSAAEAVESAQTAGEWLDTGTHSAGIATAGRIDGLVTLRAQPRQGTER